MGLIFKLIFWPLKVVWNWLTKDLQRTEQYETTQVYASKLQEFWHKARIGKTIVKIAFVIWVIQNIAVYPCETTYRVIYYWEGRKHHVCTCEYPEEIHGEYLVPTYRIGNQTILMDHRPKIFTLWAGVNFFVLKKHILQFVSR